jgi:iron uptake system EfeUOB component EfeO/EfeM
MDVMIGDQDDNSNFSCSEITWNVSVPATDIMDVTSASGKSGTISNERTVTMSVTATAEKHECDKFYRMTKNKDTRVMLVAGTKTNNQWDAGKAAAVYMPTCTISNVQHTESDSLYELTFDVTAYVDSNGSGEVYLNYL